MEYGHKRVLQQSRTLAVDSRDLGDFAFTLERLAIGVAGGTREHFAGNTDGHEHVILSD